jgi:hypothetical protein
LPALIPLAQERFHRATHRGNPQHLQLGDPASLPVLTSLLSDPEPTISDAALDGLIVFPGKDAEVALLEMFDGAPPKVRISFITRSASGG